MTGDEVEVGFGKSTCNVLAVPESALQMTQPEYVNVDVAYF